MSSTSVLEVRDLRKSYGANDVLKGVVLAFEPGQVHAFLGANGAGKSTLLGCLSGAVSPDSGLIIVRGEPHDALTPRQAFALGIAIIYQHFQVVEGLTVADNIFLGDEQRRGLRVDVRLQNRVSAELLERLGIGIDPATPLDDLSVGERQIVEIARALRHEPELLILDEPTAALGEAEEAALHDLVKTLAHDEGLAVVYVTHLLDEIDKVADVVTILRDGSVVWTQLAHQVDYHDIARAIAPATSPTVTNRIGPQPHELLRLDDFSSPFTGPIDLTVRAGEIIGLYGLLGSGRTDLLEAIAGARDHNSGAIRLFGAELRITSPVQALGHGIALVASNRKHQSLFGDLSAIDNLLMPHFRALGTRFGLRSRTNERRAFTAIGDTVGLYPKLPDLAARRFSGGNAQKLVVGRWLLDNTNVRVLLLDEPTQGVDVGARAALYELLRTFVVDGNAVLFATSDADEICELADRAVILHRGTPTVVLDSVPTADELVHLAHQRPVTTGPS